MITFGCIDVGKQKFHYHKNLIYNVGIKRIVVSKEVYFDKNDLKYFIGYEDDKKVTPLCIMLPKMSEYRKIMMKLKTNLLSFLIKDNKMLENDNEIWDKISNTIKKGFHSKPAYNEKYLKIKIKFYEESLQIFIMIKCQKKVLVVFCLSIILIDSLFNMGKNYYPQVFLEEYKCIIKDKR